MFYLIAGTGRVVGTFDPVSDKADIHILEDSGRLRRVVSSDLPPSFSRFTGLIVTLQLNGNNLIYKRWSSHRTQWTQTLLPNWPQNFQECLGTLDSPGFLPTSGLSVLGHRPVPPTHLLFFLVLGCLFPVLIFWLQLTSLFYLTHW